MKKFFRLVSMLALAGLTLTYTSCTDYSEDIDANKESIDAVSGKLATAEEQIKTINSTIEQLKTADSDAKSAIEALQKNSAALESELAALKQTHAADKAALEAALAAKVTELNGTIDQLKKDYAAADATLKTELEGQITTLETKITDLVTKHGQEIKALDEAYKNADEELKSQILANAASIATIQNDVKKLNEETIPALVKRVAALEEFKKTQEEANATFATKVALADSTKKVIALVNENVKNLTTRLEGVGSRVDSLASAHNALKASFEEAQQNHAKEIETINAKIKEIETTHGTDVAALKDSLEVARTAYEKAQKTADAAVVAANAAQATADAAVAAATAAQNTADSALSKANAALGNIASLKTALGVYANGGLEAKIDAMVAEELRTALRDSVANKTVNERVDTAVANIYAKLATLFGTKYDKTNFNTDFNKLWGEKYVTSFTETLKALNEDVTSPAYKAWEKQFKASFESEFTEAIAKAVANEGVVDSAIVKKISEATVSIKNEIDEKIGKVNTRIETIKLVLDDITNNRIQSVVFVPEYDDMNATLYNYNVAGKSLSNTLTVKATFEVYPPKLAKALAESISKRIEDVTSTEIASVVAVKVGAAATRAASPSSKGNIVAVDANDVADGRIALTVNFDNSVLKCTNLGSGAVPFAVSLRVKDNVSQTMDKTEEDPGTTFETGNYVESAFVGAKVSDACDLTSKFVVFNPETKKAVTVDKDGNIKKDMPWSVENSYWNPFEGCEFGLNVGTVEKPDYRTLSDAAKYYNLDEGVFDVVLSNTPSYSNSNKDINYFSHSKKDMAKSLADLGTSMNASKVKDKNGNLVSGALNAYCNDDVIASINTIVKDSRGVVESVEIFKAKIVYTIVSRKVTVELYNATKPFQVKWSYANAIKLTRSVKDVVAGTDTYEAYDKYIDKDFAAELGEVETSIEYNDATLKDDLDLNTILNTVVAKSEVHEVVNGIVSASALKVGDYIYSKDEKSVYTVLPSLNYVKTVAYVTNNIANVAIGGYKECFTGKTYELSNVYKPTSGTDVEVKMYVAFDKLPASVSVKLNNVELEYIPGEKSFTKLSEKPVDLAYTAAINSGLPTTGFVAVGKATALDQFTQSLADSQVYPIVADGEWCKNSVVKSERTVSAAGKKVSEDINDGYNYLVPFDATAAGNIDAGRPTDFVSYVRMSGISGINSFKNKFSFTTTLKTWYGPVFTFTATGSVKQTGFSFGFNADKVKEITDAEGNKSYSATIVGQIDGGAFKFNQEDLSKYFKVLRGDSDNLLSYVGDLAYSKLAVKYSILNNEDKKTGYENVGGESGVTIGGNTTTYTLTDNKTKTGYWSPKYDEVSPWTISVPAGFDASEDSYLSGAISNCTLDWNSYTSRDLKVQADLYYGTALVDTKVITLKADDHIAFDAFEKIDEKNTNKSESGTLVIERERKPNEDLVVDIWRFLSVKSTVEPKVENLLLQTADTYLGRWHYSNAGDKYDIDFKFELLRDQITIGGALGSLSSDKLTFGIDTDGFTGDKFTGRLVYKADAAQQANEVVIPVKVTLTHKYNWCEGVQDDHSVIIKVKVPAAK